MFYNLFFGLPLNASTVNNGQFNVKSGGEVKISYNGLNWEAWQESALFSSLKEIQWSVVRRRIEEYQSTGQTVFQYLKYVWTITNQTVVASGEFIQPIEMNIHLWVYI